MDVQSGKTRLILTVMLLTFLSFLVEDNNAYGDVVWPAGETRIGCNLFKGTWIRDESYPLYNETKCRFIKDNLNCRAQGRPDSDYQKWRWKPFGCQTPRFNAGYFLKWLIGKRLVYVGDSITENQFYSMICMLQTATSNILFNESSPDHTIFYAKDYNASVELHSAPFLVDTVKNEKEERTIYIDKIENNGKIWKGADILVFESSHWWPDSPNDTKRWDTLIEGNQTKNDMDPFVAYRKALTTWTNWTWSNIDSKNTQVFYSGTSLRHGPGCGNVTEPVLDAKAKMNPLLNIAKNVIRKSKFPIVFLNVTTLTIARKDAHPGVYIPPSEKNESETDCSHWCLAGVPDAWNQLLTNRIFDVKTLTR